MSKYGDFSASRADRTHHGPRDGTATIATALSSLRAAPRTVPPLPWRIPSRSEYNGTTAEKSAKSPTCTLAAAAARRVLGIGAWKLSSGSRFSASGIFLLGTASVRSLPCKLLFYDYESAADFVHHRGEINRQQRLLWINDYIRARARSGPRQPDRLAQAPLHPVALHRATERAAHGESNSQSRCDRRLRGGSFRSSHEGVRPLPIKHCHGRREMASPLLVHTLEIGVPQKPRVAGKGARAGWRLDTSFRFSRHTGSHSDSKFQIAISR